MSQAGDISSTSGPIPPTIPTSFVTDDGTAIPSLNVINITAVDSDENNDNGILTRADPNNSNNLFLVMTNRVRGTVTTVGAATEDLLTFALENTAASYRVHFAVVGREDSMNYCLGYTVFGSVKTDGATAEIVAEIYIDDDEDMQLNTASIDLVAVGNSVVLRVTGAAGYTINYKSLMTYTVL